MIRSASFAVPLRRSGTLAPWPALTALLWLLAWCTGTTPAQAADEYRTIEWIDLIPEADLDALMNPPDALAAIADGSAQDQLPAEGGAVPGLGDSEKAQRYRAALESTAVKPEFDGQQVRIPGFIVPLAFDETRMITEFFLVPYFGACLHSPPPPPNQIIHSRFGGGLSLDDIYDPYWLEGTLSVGIEATDLGTAAYRIEVDRVTLFDESY
ncbi:MAG: DUF3299 domain-containing protein [Pseudohaliea sp.]